MQRSEQEMAQGILVYEQGAWDSFYRVYYAPLFRLASGCWWDLDLRRWRITPEDIVQDFIGDKCEPPQQRIAMFGMTAAGIRPLLPTLMTAMKRYCVDLSRKAVTTGESLDEPVADPNHGDRQQATREHLLTIRRRVAEQLRALRKALPGGFNGGAVLPYRELLLLLERADLLPMVGRAYRLPDGGLPHGMSPPAYVESISRWSVEESKCQIGNSSLTLDGAWDELKRTAVAPRFQVLNREVAAVLGVSPNRCVVTKLRARRTVTECLGLENVVRLFPYW
ncbi:MAG: hypothetical protein NTY19_06885 [Planctomycetota bacterium]|nr:hypothetical protein [Planctomycetota bacterium]